MNNFGKKLGPLPVSINDFLNPHEDRPQMYAETKSEPTITHSLDVQRRMFALGKAVEVCGGNGHVEVLVAAREYDAFLVGQDLYWKRGVGGEHQS